MYGSFAVQKLLSLIRPYLFIFVFTSITLGIDPKEYCCNLCQKVFCLCFPLKSFIVSGLTFRSLIRFVCVCVRY